MKKNITADYVWLSINSLGVKFPKFELLKNIKVIKI